MTTLATAVLTVTSALPVMAQAPPAREASLKQTQNAVRITPRDIADTQGISINRKKSAPDGIRRAPSQLCDPKAASPEFLSRVASAKKKLRGAMTDNSQWYELTGEKPYGIYEREFGIRNTLKKLNRQLEKVADFFGNITDI